MFPPRAVCEGCTLPRVVNLKNLSPPSAMRAPRSLAPCLLPHGPLRRGPSLSRPGAGVSRTASWDLGPGRFPRAGIWLCRREAGAQMGRPGSQRCHSGAVWSLASRCTSRGCRFFICGVGGALSASSGFYKAAPGKSPTRCFRKSRDAPSPPRALILHPPLTVPGVLSERWFHFLL